MRASQEVAAAVADREVEDQAEIKDQETVTIAEAQENIHLALYFRRRL